MSEPIDLRAWKARRDLRPVAELCAIDGALAVLEEDLVAARIRLLTVDRERHPQAALAAWCAWHELDQRWNALMARRARGLGLPAVCRVAERVRRG